LAGEVLAGFEDKERAEDEHHPYAQTDADEFEATTGWAMIWIKGGLRGRHAHDGDPRRDIGGATAGNEFS